ncbi:MAG TPA: outer membrane beta-barrel protein [Spirochaetota bacterium]|nr:outer membrane beta-barrel protein [Spirochaetota bacterium]HNT09281.1 outer membrane beta-barrel protein [Spirochaetota bacterium]
MRAVRILSWGACALFLLAAQATAAHAGAVSGRLGAWDFINDDVRNRYRVAPAAMIAYTFMDKSLMSVEIASGLVYTSINYRTYRYNFYLVPTTVSYLVNITGERLPVVPYFGAGLGCYYKRDDNTTLRRSYSYTTYGYSFIAGFKLPLETGLFFYADLRYHLIQAHEPTEANLSGVSTALGAGYSFEW